MLNVDPKIPGALIRQLERTLIIDADPPSAQFLRNILQGYGAVCTFALKTDQALEVARVLNPTLIFVTIEGKDLDGIEFTTQLRRSLFSARKAPVIVLAVTPRAEAILAARNAGAHEFLCKPFSIAQLYRRLETVALKPRQWVQAKHYVGPDRRRFNSGAFQGGKKRRTDLVESTASDVVFI